VARPEQEIRYVWVGNRAVAWARAGTGPPLVFSPWWMSHLEVDWRDPLFRAFVGAFAPYRTVVRYDRPGTGLSDRDGPPPATLEQDIAVLAAVVDRLGDWPVALFGGSTGGPVAAGYTSDHPERVERLILYGTYAGGRSVAGARTPEPLDVRDRLRRISVPTLILHRKEDRAIPFDGALQLSAGTPEATLMPLAGSEHLPWRGEAGAVIRATLDFLGVPVELPS
jgi:pimeloyl-ACP methyl ester carboxylesterase